MSVETLFVVKANNSDDYKKLYDLWQSNLLGNDNYCEIMFHIDEQLVFSGSCDFIETLMNIMEGIEAELKSEKETISYTVFGRAEDDYGMATIFELKTDESDCFARASYASGEDDEEAFYHYMSLEPEEIPKALNRRKFRSFKEIRSGKYYDYLLTFEQNEADDEF